MNFDEIKNLSDKEKSDVIMLLYMYINLSWIDFNELDVSENSRRVLADLISKIESLYLH